MAQPLIPPHLLRRRRPPSSLTLPVIVIISILAALVLSFSAIPLVFSMPNQLWKGTVGFRRGWDSLNIALVLFAIFCGIFAPKRGDEAAAEEASWAGDGANMGSLPKAEKAIEMTAQQWFQSIDRRIYDLPEERVPVVEGRVGRSGSLYPDLIQESCPAMGEGGFRSLDNFTVEGDYRRLDQPATVPLRRWQSVIDESEIKEISVHTLVRGSRSPPPSEALQEQAKLRPPPNMPSIATQRKRSTYDYETVGVTAATPPPPPPPPPPAPWREQSPEQIERRKSSATAEIKGIIASVLSANKRKKRRLKARTIEESVSARHSVDETPDRRIPPPPSPPPQPQSFLRIFKKTTKTRRIHCTSAQPPHPPPSPLEQGRRSAAKPPLPKKPKKNRDDREARLPPGIPTASTLPPPSTFAPYRRRRSRESGIAEAEGDASWTGKKRVTSSSDGDGAKESGHADGEDTVKGGGPGPALFCESPDVNAKADTFIARLKDGWRIERMNSIREKHGLGPGPS